MTHDPSLPVLDGWSLELPLEPDEPARAHGPRRWRRAGSPIPRVLDAMREIPRERFVDEALRRRPTATPRSRSARSRRSRSPGSWRACPSSCQPDGTGRVLEIGTGSGYHAAVLAQAVRAGLHGGAPAVAVQARARRPCARSGSRTCTSRSSTAATAGASSRPTARSSSPPRPPTCPSRSWSSSTTAGASCSRSGESQGAAEQTLVRVITDAAASSCAKTTGSCRFVPLVGKFGWTS